mmetsp:Transcript_1062/g.1276  ORF Transcript_1062/g.1276 Transcript_1062/m.1276 type:complete len:262 (-) Transcript_1062:253-1038(-)|eukprot:CAMPEP_0203636436 /NCGR_PEP_ID=MMETSP0088-20131115/2980_1 /ASSEMBLY_ACC=CAM_ASM_001087 /TAXON_ID=426623 /ORGANISM="Chaetoceros affinis, Strain CCMP159" /LENGTH=261 /DNA_ID=CAMNT_0050490563 /DNA_START=107 /DNA_END=892 /DNA_ORIENTATION=-
MADDKLRSVLVFRIENGSDAVLLANYDYMSDYEAHAGAATEGNLYDGRGKGYSEAVTLVVSSDPPGQTSPDAIGGFKHQQSDAHQVLYGGDADGLCIAVVSGLRYPSRVATQMLTEIYSEYKATFGIEAKTAVEKSLTRRSKTMLSNYCKKYSTIESVDKAAQIQSKVNAVKSKMQDNIADMLNNMERAESISNTAEELNEQANVFQKSSKTLKKTMRCKNNKMNLIIALLVGGILLIILVPLISKAVGAGAKNNNDNGGD